MMIRFNLLHPKMTEEHLGSLPLMLVESDPRTAAQQINDRYSFGGGWYPTKSFKLLGEWTELEKRCSPYTLVRHLILEYPGDPPLKPLAVAQLRDETIMFYLHSWVAIFQENYTFEIARID